MEKIADQAFVKRRGPRKKRDVTVQSYVPAALQDRKSSVIERDGATEFKRFNISKISFGSTGQAIKKLAEDNKEEK